MGSNKFIITKIKCWPVFKQDPSKFKSLPYIDSIDSDGMHLSSMNEFGLYRFRWYTIWII